MRDLKKRLSNLIDVKSIVTFMVLGTFVFLAAKGNISAENVMIIVTTIITFFFAKPASKNKDE